MKRFFRTYATAVKSTVKVKAATGYVEEVIKDVSGGEGITSVFILKESKIL